MPILLGLKSLKRHTWNAYVKFRILTGNMNYLQIDKLIAPEYYNKAASMERNYNKSILFGDKGNETIRTFLESNNPLMLTRLGGTELDCVEHYLKNRNSNESPYPPNIKHRISTNAGVFPTDDKFLDRFSDFFINQIKNTDIMGVLFNEYEAPICSNYCSDATLVELGCIEPYHWEVPWSSQLKGKKVLVVHPFADSIKKQYAEKRRLLFKNLDVLPDFEIITLKAVQSSAHSKVNFATWFDAYQYMCTEIENTNFDIAIIGAGAYGLPLASFVKNLGKQGINIGGFTQVMFGIKGRRYEIEYEHTTARLFNKHWIKPSSDETPESFKNVEGGCYW